MYLNTQSRANARLNKYTLQCKLGNVILTAYSLRHADLYSKNTSLNEYAFIKIIENN